MSKTLEAIKKSPARKRPEVGPAMKGSEIAKSWRAQISSEMNSNQIAEAQRLAREWLTIPR